MCAASLASVETRSERGAARIRANPVAPTSINRGTLSEVEGSPRPFSIFSWAIPLIPSFANDGFRPPILTKTRKGDHKRDHNGGTGELTFSSVECKR